MMTRMWLSLALLLAPVALGENNHHGNLRHLKGASSAASDTTFVATEEDMWRRAHRLLKKEDDRTGDSGDDGDRNNRQVDNDRSVSNSGLVESVDCVPFEELGTEIANSKTHSTCTAAGGGCSGCCRKYDYLICDRFNAWRHLECACDAQTREPGRFVGWTITSGGQTAYYDPFRNEVSNRPVLNGQSNPGDVLVNNSPVAAGSGTNPVPTSPPLNTVSTSPPFNTVPTTPATSNPAPTNAAPVTPPAPTNPSPPDQSEETAIGSTPAGYDPNNPKPWEQCLEGSFYHATAAEDQRCFKAEDCPRSSECCIRNFCICAKSDSLQGGCVPPAPAAPTAPEVAETTTTTPQVTTPVVPQTTTPPVSTPVVPQTTSAPVALGEPVAPNQFSPEAPASVTPAPIFGSSPVTQQTTTAPAPIASPTGPAPIASPTGAASTVPQTTVPQPTEAFIPDEPAVLEQNVEVSGPCGEGSMFWLSPDFSGYTQCKTSAPSGPCDTENGECCIEAFCFCGKPNGPVESRCAAPYN